MPERVIVHQDKAFQTRFEAANPHDAESDQTEPVMHLHDLTPYGMLLASVGSCTAIVLNSYAQNHDIPLESVSVEAVYDRVFADDCKDCDEDTEYEEIIREGLTFSGDLSDKDRKRLHQVAKYCSIRRLLEQGIRIESE